MKEYQKAMEAYNEGLKLEENNAELIEGVRRAVEAMNGYGTQSKQSSEEAMNDPEVQEILSDPIMRQILQDMQTNPGAAQK